MNWEERDGTRKTGYHAGGIAVLATVLCLTDAAHAQLRGAESGWAGRPGPGSTDAANDGGFRIRLAPPTLGETDGYGPTPNGDTFRASAGFGGFAESETGAGLDLGGGLSFAERSSGASVDFRARGLTPPADGVGKWGLSGALRMAPNARGRGLSLSFLPWWAEDADEAERPWPPGSTSLLARENGNTGLEAEVGYGLDAFDGRGVLTPYVGVSEAGRGREVRAGVRLSFAAIRGAISGATERTASSDPDRHSVGGSMRMPLGAHPVGTAPASPP